MTSPNPILLKAGLGTRARLVAFGHLKPVAASQPELRQYADALTDTAARANLALLASAKSAHVRPTRR